MSPRRNPAACFPILAASVLLAAGPSFALAGDWKGKEVTENGMLHVRNPAQPAEPPVTSALEELFRLGGETDDDDQIFGVITQVRTDEEGNVYLLDSQLNEIRKFSPTGEFLDVIGREGEGPGEFRNPNGFFRLPNGNWGVIQAAPGRIAQLSREGEPLSDHPIPASEDGGFVVLRSGNTSSQRLFLSLQRNKPGEGKFTMEVSLSAVDEEGDVTATFHTAVREMVFASPVIDEDVWDTFDRRWEPLPDGRVLAVLSNSHYAIRVWTADGSVERVIEREYPSFPRSGEELERVREVYRRFIAQLPGAEIKISSNTPAIHSIYARADGSIWVLSGRGARENPAGTIGTFDVFSPDGRFARQVTLRGEGDARNDQFLFAGDRLFVITGFLEATMNAFAGPASEEDAGKDIAPLEVICYRLDDDALAMN